MVVMLDLRIGIRQGPALPHTVDHCGSYSDIRRIHRHLGANVHTLQGQNTAHEAW